MTQLPAHVFRFIINVERSEFRLDVVGMVAKTWRVENWQRLKTARSKIRGSDESFSSAERHGLLVENDGLDEWALKLGGLYGMREVVNWQEVGGKWKKEGL